MRYQPEYDQEFCLAVGITDRQGQVYNEMLSVTHWRGVEKRIIDGTIYYHISRQLLIHQLPLLTTKADTMYRHMKALQQKKLIYLFKFGKKDFVIFNEIAAENWGVRDKDPGFKSGKKSEAKESSSEKNPKINPQRTGLKAEKNPTYNTNSSSSDKIVSEEDASRASTQTKSTTKKIGSSGSADPAFRSGLDIFHEMHKAYFQKNAVPDPITLDWSPKERGNLNRILKALRKSRATKSGIKSKDISVEMLLADLRLVMSHMEKIDNGWYAKNHYTPSGIWSQWNTVVNKIQLQKNGSTNSKKKREHSASSVVDASEIERAIRERMQTDSEPSQG